MGNVISVTDPVNNQTSYTYDAQNRVTAETNELGFTRTFEYDDNGNAISTTDRNGRTREFTFDGLNRQVEENWLDDAGNSIRTTNSEYDAASQLIATDDPDSAYNFIYIYYWENPIFNILIIGRGSPFSSINIENCIVS